MAIIYCLEKYRVSLKLLELQNTNQRFYIIYYLLGQKTTLHVKYQDKKN